METLVESPRAAGAGSAKPKILILSYLFPPAGGIAVQRALSLAKYLPDSGFEVHVLHAANAAAPVEDPKLREQVPSNVTIHTAFTPEVPFWIRHTVWKWLVRGKGDSAPRRAAPTAAREGGLKAIVTGLIRRVLCPEPEILWYPFALREASRIIRTHGIEIVMVTAPPFSAFVAGNALKRRFPAIKYCADFRDEWISFYLKDFEYQSSEYTKRRAIEIERDTVESADLVVAVTDSSLAKIRSRYPEQPAWKFLCISNGFDPDAFKEYHPRPNREKRLIVTHVGTVYKTASPQYFLDALDELPPEVRDGIEIRFIGRVSEAELNQFEGRKSAIKLLGFMPQNMALKTMEETDCLLLTMTNDISMPGKLYEYLAARKPILALSPHGGEVQQFIDQTQAGWCVDYRDRPAIQSLVQRMCEQKAAGPGQLRTPDEAAVRAYERPQLVAAYAKSLAALLKTP